MNPLQDRKLSGTMLAVSLNERARERLKAEKARRHITEQDLAGMLHWSQSKVAQKFNGRTPITLDELEGLCFCLSLSPAEVVRDRGLEFCAEMTPSELRFLEKVRQLPQRGRDGLFALLEERIRVTQPERFATEPEKRTKKRR